VRIGEEHDPISVEAPAEPAQAPVERPAEPAEQPEPVKVGGDDWFWGQWFAQNT